MKRILFWFPRLLFVAYIVFASTYALAEAAGKGITPAGIGMLAILAVFVGGVVYLAWTNPRTGGPIMLLVGVFGVIVAFTYQEKTNWLTFYNSLPLLIAGGLLTAEGFKLYKTRK